MVFILDQIEEKMFLYTLSEIDEPIAFQEAIDSQNYKE